MSVKTRVENQPSPIIRGKSATADRSAVAADKSFAGFKSFSHDMAEFSLVCSLVAALAHPAKMGDRFANSSSSLSSLFSRKSW
ncbi:MAG: hypothetical protein ABI690_02280 [Chloroflexota bacterium]